MGDKPVEGGEFKQLGFSSLIRITDLFDTKDFLKNDAMVLSVQIRDMTNAPQRGFIGDVYSTPGDLSFTVDNTTSSAAEVTTPPPPSADEAAEGVMSFSSAIAVALISSFLVFLMMASVLLCISNSHQKSINAITKVTAKRNTKDVETFHNLNYLHNEEKV